MLQLIRLSKTFHQPDGDIRVLESIDFKLDYGCSAALLGESGSGKSTLLHLIAGLDRPDSGDIILAGHSTAKFSDNDWNDARRSLLSLVFQTYHLVPTLSIANNLQLQARLCGRLDKDFRDHLVDRLGLSQLLSRLPHQLSGGQQQRVAIARALLHKPKLVMADEPTGNLDPETAERVHSQFLSLIRDEGLAALIATHNLELARSMSRVVQLHGGQLVEI